MSPRDDFFAVLEGRKPRNVPVWLLFPYHATGYYVDVRTNPLYRHVHDMSLEYAVTLNRRGLGTPVHVCDAKWEQQQLDIEKGRHVKSRILNWKDISLFEETVVTPAGTRVKKLLDNEDDLEAFCSIPVETDEAVIHACLDSQMDKFLAEKKDFPEHLGSMMLDLGEPVNCLYHYSNLEEYSMWSLTHDDMVCEHLERMMEQKSIVYRYCLERGLADVYLLVGSELASPPMVSRETFQRWIVPYATELIGLIHSYGKKVIQHYHGQIRDILPDFLKMAPDALHTIEAPPVGNCTLDEAFSIVGDKIALIGNIQYDEFRSLDGAGMAEAVRSVIQEAAGRRFILSPTAGPFDENASEQFLRNYEIFMKTAREAGQLVDY